MVNERERSGEPGLGVGWGPGPVAVGVGELVGGGFGLADELGELEGLGLDFGDTDGVGLIVPPGDAVGVVGGAGGAAAVQVMSTSSSLGPSPGHCWAPQNGLSPGSNTPPPSKTPRRVTPATAGEADLIVTIAVPSSSVKAPTLWGPIPSSSSDSRSVGSPFALGMKMSTWVPSAS